MRIALAVVLALGACRSPSSGERPQPPSSGSTAAVELAAFVPADTAVAIFVERSLLDHPFGDVMTDGSLDEPRRDLADAASTPRETPGDHFWGTIAAELAPLDEAAVRNAGWWPGKSEMVMYTVGLVPVLRVRGDGTRFRALLDRASKASGLKLTEASWKGVPYLVFVPEPGGPQILVAHSADQIVLMVAAQPEAVLDHLTTFTVPERETLATSWSIGAGADRFLYLDPARLGALLGRRDEVVRLVGLDEELPAEACMAAAGRAIATLPRTTSTLEVDDRRFNMQVVLDVAAETAALYRGTALPGWPDVRAGVPMFRLGVGVAPYPVTMRTVPMYERLVEAGRICGEEVPPLQLAELAPLQVVQTATVELAAFDGREMTMTLSLGVRDVPALWTLISGALPFLGPTVPAIGEIRDIPGGPIHIGVGRERIIGAIGAGATARIKEYIAAEAGPRMPLLGHMNHEFMRGYRDGTFQFLGKPMVDDDPSPRDLQADATFGGRVEGSRLIFDITLTIPERVNRK